MSGQNKVSEKKEVVIDNSGFTICPLITHVTSILKRAVKIGASQVSFVPQKDGSLDISVVVQGERLPVRFSEETPEGFRRGSIVRIKIMSGMMISRKDEIQVGIIRNDNFPQMAVEVKPTEFGESAEICF